SGERTAGVMARPSREFRGRGPFHDDLLHTDRGDGEQGHGLARSGLPVGDARRALLRQRPELGKEQSLAPDLGDPGGAEEVEQEQPDEGGDPDGRDAHDPTNPPPRTSVSFWHGGLLELGEIDRGRFLHRPHPAPASGERWRPPYGVAGRKRGP